MIYKPTILPKNEINRNHKLVVDLFDTESQATFKYNNNKYHINLTVYRFNVE